jgi:hypothetical protein
VVQAVSRERSQLNRSVSRNKNIGESEEMYNKINVKHVKHQRQILRILVFLVFILFPQIIIAQLPSINDFNHSTIKLAASNIINKVNNTPSKSILVVASKDKKDFASWIIEELENRKINHNLLLIGCKLDSNIVPFQTLIRTIANNWGLIFLIGSQDAPFLFETIGRSDLNTNVKPIDPLFCNWLIKTESIIRTYGIDMQELYAFREKLVNKIQNAKTITITSPKGTDITVTPRFWKETEGEICTAPVEDESNGTVVIDGCAYWGPPEKPFNLEIRNGRVINISSLDKSDKQQSFVYNDLTRDKNSNLLAELGIGINPGANWDEELMESEQARGTCHFGFGRNLQFQGGTNESSYHFDLVIQKPTIEVDGKFICIEGNYQF